MAESSLIDELFSIGVLKFGNFTLKSGVLSPIYVDLRIIVGYPSLLRKISEQMWSKMVEQKISTDCLCGVPYAALPLASVISIDHDIPMLIRRKEAKDYGTQRLIEGNLIENQKCLIIEDVVTTGSSIIETAKILRQHNLIVSDAVVILDRQSGAEPSVKSEGINLHSIFTLNEILDHLHQTDKISKIIFDEVKEFVRKTSSKNGTQPDIIERRFTPFLDRKHFAKHPKLKQLYEIMCEKKSNLCVAADLTDCQSILKLVAKIGSEICMLKLHVDIIDDFSSSFVDELKKYSENLNFMILEDRKFADIGNTVRSQFNAGVFKISSWVHFVTVHTVAGSGVLEGLREVCINNNVGCLIVAEMSSKNALCNNNSYRTASMKLGQEYSDIVAGFICQKRLKSDDDSFIYMTPGVHIDSSSDSMKQKWRNPEEAITLDGNDIIIVGRGITEASDVHAAAAKYKSIGWQSLTQ